MAESASINKNDNARQSFSFDNIINNMTALPVARQISLIVGLSASVALIVAILLWSQSTNYALLFGNMEPSELNEVVQILDSQRVNYKLDSTGSSVLVPANQVHSLRLQLAADGYPRPVESGYQLLDRDQGFGISQFRETTQFHRALEGELARSVASINQVESARVMLGLPKRSVFVREQQAASASVVLRLRSGRSLDEQNVAAIVHLVAASVPNLDSANVTVVDQFGNLLSNSLRTSDLHLSMRQLDYTRDIEDSLSQRVINLMAPILGGANRVRAQVSAELDFTQVEQTRENFDPDPRAIRSEQEIREINRDVGPQGIPGALTNQPPPAGLAPEELLDPANDPSVRNLSERRTRNFEIDRTISHIKNPAGALKRLSVAVVLDDRLVNVDGEIQRQALTEDELASFRQIISDSLGLDTARGDTLSLINTAFVAPEESFFESGPIWEEVWFWDAIKHLVAAIAILVIVFGVVRPMLRDLGQKNWEQVAYPEDVLDEELTLATPDISQALDQMNREIGNESQTEDESTNNSELFDKVRELATSDPKLVAMVLKEWMQEKK
ncbi:flagellar basal-body MS-ring/collar protein FliF [Thiomicrospira sp. ALE5]|uniref:flagellar basal-body MS-ring/collar protein FliF n=1 Tax=Thiomicrospira sp. ALE5 TaxID=748650 RepID=UPI0008E6AE24|nr:flagellar basal-body MS-ring/collar protein FliF [Thiomicrospira sp. ALE5]SFR59282.1 flagellar M-ring protein FliF [Thiomicrospira sp. ALE5]